MDGIIGYPWSKCRICGDAFDTNTTYAFDFSVCRDCAEGILAVKAYEEPGTRCSVCDEQADLAGDGSFGEEFGVCRSCAVQISEFYLRHHGTSGLDLRPRPRRPIADRIRWRVFQRDHFTCQKCGETGVPLTIDHIVSLAKGGTEEEGNYQTLCRSCNCTKGTH